MDCLLIRDALYKVRLATSIAETVLANGDSSRLERELRYIEQQLTTIRLQLQLIRVGAHQ